MFKNLMAYRIGNPETMKILHDPDLEDSLLENLTEEPHKTQWRKLGFAKSPAFGEDSALFEGAMGTRAVGVCLQERILPGRVINQHLATRIERLAELEGRRPHKKEIASLKDDVIAQLLPQAFVKASHYSVMITQDWLFIDTASTKLADEIVAFLRDAIAPESGLHLQPLSGPDVRKWLRGIAIEDGETEDKPFRHLEAATLKSKTEGIIRLKDVDFADPEAQEVLLSNRAVVELAMGWREDTTNGGADDLQFTINDHLIIKRLKFSDILIQQTKDDAGDESAVARFDTDVAIFADRFVKLVNAISKANPVEDDKKEEDDEL